MRPWDVALTHGACVPGGCGVCLSHHPGWAQTPILIHNPIDDNAEIGVRE
jgi:hypothetical protein